MLNCAPLLPILKSVVQLLPLGARMVCLILPLCPLTPLQEGLTLNGALHYLQCILWIWPFNKLIRLLKVKSNDTFGPLIWLLISIQYSNIDSNLSQAQVMTPTHVQLDPCPACLKQQLGVDTLWAVVTDPHTSGPGHRVILYWTEAAVESGSPLGDWAVFFKVHTAHLLRGRG